MAPLFLISSPIRLPVDYRSPVYDRITQSERQRERRGLGVVIDCVPVCNNASLEVVCCITLMGSSCASLCVTLDKWLGDEVGLEDRGVRVACSSVANMRL